MKINLKKKPEKPIIIEGFPGFGLVGNIVTQFLVEHMECEKIGEFVYDEFPAVATIHNGELVDPMSVYYSKKYNIIILQTILNVKGYEWEIADNIIKMAKELKSPRIISVEGMGSKDMSPNKESKLYYYGSEDFEEHGIKKVAETVIIGVTGAMLLKSKKLDCLFAETHSALPDSKAAAKVIEVLDKDLGLDVDYKPLIKQAENFESQLKKLLKESTQTAQEADKKNLTYLG